MIFSSKFNRYFIIGLIVFPIVSIGITKEVSYRLTYEPFMSSSYRFYPQGMTQMCDVLGLERKVKVAAKVQSKAFKSLLKDFNSISQQLQEILNSLSNVLTISTPPSLEHHT